MSQPTANANPEAQFDLELIAAVAGGDEQALRRLMDRHLARVTALAQRILGSAAEADDVAQEAFTRVWQHARSFDARRAQFGTWLYRIACNLCLDRQRRRRGEWEEIGADLADPAPDPAQQEERRQLRAALVAGLARLTVRHRAALVLHYVEELSAREAAEAMGLREKAFESLVLRARRALREHLQAIYQEANEP